MVLTNAGVVNADTGTAKMNDLLIILLVVAVWVFVQAWLLPKLGIST